MGKKNRSFTDLLVAISSKFQIITRAAENTDLTQLLLTAIAGAAAGLFIWSMSVDPREFNSYLFRNELLPEERSKLLLLLFLGAGCFLILRKILINIFRYWSGIQMKNPEHKISCFLSFGILAGFIPFLMVEAIEVYYPIQTICLVTAFLGILFFLCYRIYRTPSVNGVEIIGKKDKSAGTGLLIISILSAAYAGFFCIYTITKHLAFHSYSFDLGWQNQVFYTLLHTGIPRVTGFLSLNHLSNHFQPLYYLLAPLYALYQNPILLLALQSVLLSAAAVPIYLFTIKRTGNSWISLIISSIYLLYPALHGLNTYDFHGIVLLIPIMCFLLYALESGRKRLFWVLFVLALITREDTAVSLSGIGLYVFFILKSRKQGTMILMVSIGYFFLTMTIMSVMGGFANLENYWLLSLPENENFIGVITTVITNPFFVFKHVFLNPEKLLYLIILLLPLMFLPLFSGKRMIIIIPALAVILFSGTSAQFSIGFQYSAHLIPFLFFLSVYGLENIRKHLKVNSTLLFAVPLLAAGLLMNFEYGLVFSKRYPGILTADKREKTAFSFFEMIPGEASVATISRLYPHLSSRREIFLLHRMRPDTEYILADLYPAHPASDIYEQEYRGHTLNPAQVRSIVLRLLRSNQYGVLNYKDGFILLKSGYPISGNRIIIDNICTTVYPSFSELIKYYRDPALRMVDIPESISEQFKGFLQMHRTETLLLSVKGDAVRRLSYMTKKYLLMHGSNIHTLRNGGSYAAVIQGGEVVMEVISNNSGVEIDSMSVSSLDELIPGKTIYLRSGGSEYGKDSSIRIDGKEYSLNQRGFNAVVLDYSFQVRDMAVFDTSG